jgi:hypothetical protein
MFPFHVYTWKNWLILAIICLGLMAPFLIMMSEESGHAPPPVAARCQQTASNDTFELLWFMTMLLATK